MSDDVIKVHDLPGIAQYSESIKQFSQSLTTATQDTARTFNVKIEGSEGEAIAAFLGQLNTLQNQVFNQIPVFLNKYSANVGKFSSAVSGGGFTKEAWTSESGLSTVQSKLTGEQVDKVSEVDQKLQSAMNIATDALDEPEINISSVKSGAILSLNASSLTRQATHEPFQLAHDLFNKDLQTTIAEVSVLRGIINQAQITLNLTPKAVFNMITQGLKMNPIDTVQNIDEAIALDSVYGDDQTKISKVNRKNVRNEVIFHMVDGMTAWVLEKDTSKLKKFYDQFGEMNTTESTAWFDTFTTVGKVLAISHQVVMEEKYNKVNGDYGQMDAEFAKENAINEIIGINRGLYAIRFGKNTYRPNGSNIPVADPHRIFFKFNSDGTTQFTTMGQVSGYKVEEFKSTLDQYNSDFKVNSSSVTKQEILDNLEELDSDKQKAVFETIRDIASGAGTVFFPQYRAAFEMFKLIGADYHDVIETNSPAAASLVKGITDWNKADKKANELKEKLKMEMIYKGAWSFKGVTGAGTQKIMSDKTYYRFEVTQRISEMDKYGVKLFFEEKMDPGSFTKYANVLNQEVNEGTLDSDVRDYVLGKESNLAFESMDYKKLKQVHEAIKSIDKIQNDWEADDGEKYYDYLKTKYYRKKN